MTRFPPLFEFAIYWFYGTLYTKGTVSIVKYLPWFFFLRRLLSFGVVAASEKYRTQNWRYTIRLANIDVSSCLHNSKGCWVKSVLSIYDKVTRWYLVEFHLNQVWVGSGCTYVNIKATFCGLLRQPELNLFPLYIFAV